LPHGFLVIAPVCASYFAAKLARQQPLLHGLLIGIIGAFIIGFTVYTRDQFTKVTLIAIVVLSGLFGGWLWRYRNIPRDQEI
jgi:fluoride ion exporter CrcB/FEX